MLKIAHLETGRHLYGGPVQVLLLLDGLRERGVESVLVAPEGADVAEEAKHRGHRVRTLPFRGEADLRFVPRFRSLLVGERPDLVQLHSRRGADTLGLVAARLWGGPIVLTRRVDNPEPAWLARLKYASADRVVAISEGIRRVLLSEGVPGDRVRTVRSAIRADEFQTSCDVALASRLGIAEGGPWIGVVAQLIERKGHRVLLDALPEILRHAPHARVVFFGKGPLRRALEAEVRSRGLEGSVHLTGFRGDLGELLPCLDLLVHPALMEGLGVAVLEAAASAVPAVASSVGGLPEAVEHGRTGLLVPAGDAGALAEAVVQLLSDPERAAVMGRSARERVEREHSPHSMVEGNLAVYEEVLEARAARAAQPAE